MCIVRHRRTVCIWCLIEETTLYICIYFHASVMLQAPPPFCSIRLYNSMFLWASWSIDHAPVSHLSSDASSLIKMDGLIIFYFYRAQSDGYNHLKWEIFTLYPIYQVANLNIVYTVIPLCFTASQIFLFFWMVTFKVHHRFKIHISNRRPMPVFAFS